MTVEQAMDGVRNRIAELEQQVSTLTAELLRVRTTGHGAAHELDNIAVECGLGHSPKPGDVTKHVRTITASLRECKDLAEEAWGIIANAGSGNWQLETAVWREAATRFRSKYHTLLTPTAPASEDKPVCKECGGYFPMPDGTSDECPFCTPTEGGPR